MNPSHEQHPPPAPGPVPPAGPPVEVPPAPATGPPHGPGEPPPHAPVPVEQVHYQADQAFAPGGGLPWAPVSRRFTVHRWIAAALTAVPVALAGALVVFRGVGAGGMVVWLAAILLCVVLSWIVTELAFRSYGYAERADDLVIRQGVFVRRMLVVPYGRMQFVDVTAGLLEQWMGIATVRMHTAAAATDAHIPGLPAAEAAALRDRLAQKGEERSMGL